MGVTWVGSANKDVTCQLARETHRESFAPLNTTPEIPQLDSFPTDPAQVTFDTWAVDPQVESSTHPMPRGEVRLVSSFEKSLQPTVRSIAVLQQAPWIRNSGPLTSPLKIQSWKFPVPWEPAPPDPSKKGEKNGEDTPGEDTPLNENEETTALEAPQEGEPEGTQGSKTQTRILPPAGMSQLKDRLLCLLQPPLEGIIGQSMKLPFQPYPYQLQGIAFLVPRTNALIADEMGLGKTVQVILSVRLLIQTGQLHRALIVCPKPLVPNWMREFRLWAPEIPFEVIGGNADERRRSWQLSNAPVKIVNYEILTRDEEDYLRNMVRWDLVVLDEAQRVKNRDSRTSLVVKSLERTRSWAMSGTPIENRVEDMVNLFDFVEPGLIPPETPVRNIPGIVKDHIIRRTKEMVAGDMPPRIYRDLPLELSPEQKDTYELAEKEGIVHLNELGDTISVQHVFELVMRLKQICNFDPRTGRSAKLERLVADMEEVSSSGRKAIVFSQWVEPLETIAQSLKDHGPLLYHGRIPTKERQPILDRFKEDPDAHVLLMSYGTGSVGLNLQFTNYVFLYDRWWNPAIEDQAINRAHRLGQKSAVFITRFTSVGTVEERIAAVLDRKRQLFEEMLSQNGPPISMGLTEDEIFGLFDIQARPKRAA